MMKQLKKGLLTASVSVALCAGSQIANAGVYADARLDLSNLNVAFSNLGPGSAVTSFNFNVDNTAFLDGAGAVTNDNCNGTVASNNCGPSGSVLDPNVANAPGSNPLQGNNAFTKLGPGVDQYSHADAVLREAELVTAAATNGTQMAQSEIQSVDSASANSNLSSATTLEFVINVAADGATVTVTFAETLYLEADVNLAGFDVGNAQADSRVEVKLRATNTNTNSDVDITWTPQGTAANDCSVSGGNLVVPPTNGVTCSETADGFKVNNQVSGGGSSDSDIFSDTGSFGVVIGNLAAGQYVLTLNSVVSTNLSITRGVPVPGTVLLFGLGLLGMAGARKIKLQHS